MMKPCMESDEEEEIVRMCNRGTEEQQLDNLPLRGKDDFHILCGTSKICRAS